MIILTLQILQAGARLPLDVQKSNGGPLPSVRPDKHQQKKRKISAVKVSAADALEHASQCKGKRQKTSPGDVSEDLIPDTVSRDILKIAELGESQRNSSENSDFTTALYLFETSCKPFLLICKTRFRQADFYYHHLTQAYQSSKYKPNCWTIRLEILTALLYSRLALSAERLDLLFRIFLLYLSIQLDMERLCVNYIIKLN